MSVTELNMPDFKSEVLESNVPVLVDFWAPWCGPCLTVAPILKDIAEEQAGKLRVVKINIDDNPELAAAYNIRSIPAFKVFKNGQTAVEFGGAMPKSQFEKLISEHIA